jgi:predicted DNA-binding transcriptional regulator YafY
MMARVDRTERLLNLVLALLDTRRSLRGDEIRERVPGYPPAAGAFHRAFERDKETLRAMGIPLTVEYLDPGDPEAGQGYRIHPEHYALRDPGLDSQEVAALQLASQAVRLTGADPTAAIWKLGGVQPGDAAAPVERGSLPGSEYLAALFTAATERRTVTFEYRGGRRSADPWKLGFRNGFWYLVAWDHDREDRRTFRLDRFTSVPDLGPPGTFARPDQSADTTTPAWEMGDQDPADVSILVDADQVRWAIDVAGEHAVVERRPDGSVILQLRVTNRPGLRSFVLGMLDHAEILAPPEERQAMMDWLAAIAADAA